MADDTPIQSALQAEQNARRAVEEARNQAAVIRQRAREGARRIEQRAELRIKRLHGAIDGQIDARKRAIEREGADALRELRHDAIDQEIFDDAIDTVIRKIMTESNSDDPSS